jgi:hypothetical protein
MCGIMGVESRDDGSHDHRFAASSWPSEEHRFSLENPVDDLLLLSRKLWLRLGRHRVEWDGGNRLCHVGFRLLIRPPAYLIRLRGAGESDIGVDSRYSRSGRGERARRTLRTKGSEGGDGLCRPCSGPRTKMSRGARGRSSTYDAIAPFIFATIISYRRDWRQDSRDYAVAA